MIASPGHDISRAEEPAFTRPMVQFGRRSGKFEESVSPSPDALRQALRIRCRCRLGGNQPARSAAGPVAKPGDYSGLKQ